METGASPGERLPPERELAGKLGVSRGELRKALSALESEGVVERHVGRGTFLRAAADTCERCGSSAPAGSPQSLSRRRRSSRQWRSRSASERRSVTMP